VNLKAAIHGTATIAAALVVSACQKSETAPTPAPVSPPASAAAFAVTFGENPVPFRSTGCNGASPQGWYTTARIQETAGVAFTAARLTQKLEGAVAGVLNESFDSRFGACSGAAFTPGAIAARGAACGIVGVCTTDTYRTYQLEISGTDANGHAVTFSSPVLQLDARAAARADPFGSSTLTFADSRR
jgi:hypothetical protein